MRYGREQENGWASQGLSCIRSGQDATSPGTFTLLFVL